MQIDLSQYIKFTPEEFINDGIVFNLCLQNSSKTKEISVISQIKKEGGVYKLIIKGNYKRGSSITIEIGNNESTVDNMYKIAKGCMDQYIPPFLFEDYPESLKKVAKDKARLEETRHQFGADSTEYKAALHNTVKN